MKKEPGTIIAIIAALVLGFFAGILYDHFLDNAYDVEELEQRLVEVSELATLECEYTDQGTYTGDAKTILGFKLPFTSKSMQIQYSGKVKAGPVLKDNMEIALDESAGKISVKIPHSQILSHEVDEDSLKIIYVKNGVFNSVTPEDTNTLRKETKKKKEESILKSDFLEQADAKAVEQITTFLKTACPDLEVSVELK